MSIAPALLQAYPSMNQAQRAIVHHSTGPLLVIAGPGSGKTFSLVLRAMNLLLLGKATPRELVICTFTEKAAFELRDRLFATARKLAYIADLSELHISTIHGWCHRLLTAYRHRTPLGNDYDTLDELTELLFIFEHFDKIVRPPVNGCYLGRWKTRWTAITGLRSYFDKITEELVDPGQLIGAADPFLCQLGAAYKTYQQTLLSANRLDFAHQQKLVYDLLLIPEVAQTVRRGVKYVMVDEYQDTNFIQEQLLLKLTEGTHNLCVVGDEDQSLYRFRGATVRNILEFTTRVPDCTVVKLTTNYRSHRRIVEAYNRWMASADWSNPHGIAFRYDKTIEPDLSTKHPDYSAIFAIWGKDGRDEAERFADLVAFLKQHEVIADYSQVVLLLHSVRLEHSGPYLAALEAKGIPAFCPRARAYFDNEEGRLLIACLAVIFGYYGDGRGDVSSGTLAELAAYVDAAIVELGRRYGGNHPLAEALRGFVADIASLQEGESLDLRPADYFYRLLALEPFRRLVQNDNRARNLAMLSQLLNTFQNYYHYTVVTYRNHESLRFHLFNSFLRLLYSGGINEYEDPDQPFPKGYVQVMTIHQAKGLEFPVVVVGSLDTQLSTPKQIDRDLQPYYQRPPFEPAPRITLFDRMRLHYVAFSRPEKLLVLTAHTQPKDHFARIWQGLPQWPYVQQDLLAAQHFHVKNRLPIKRSFSFTGDLKVYETCPRQYQFFREYNFTPSRSAVIFFGLLVHQTIEELHRLALDGQRATLTEARIHTLFERTFRFLTMADVRPIGDTAKAAAFTQVMHYFRQNQDEMQRVIETEVDVSVEKDGYILTGKVDLLMSGDGRLELLDFKTSPKPVDSPALLQTYERSAGHLIFRNAGVLFFAKEVRHFFLQAYVTCLLFKGTDRVNILDRKDFAGGVVNDIEESLRFIARNTRTAYRIERLQREEIPEYPMRALREAITNAVMHRDYFEMGANVFVEIYDDRIEIVSPGGLPKGLNPEELGSRSVRRNQLIADLLQRIGYIEKAGTGIRRMQDEAREHQCPTPRFTANGFFTAVFRPTSAEIHKETKSGRRRKQVTEQVTAVLEAARVPRSREELQKVVGLKHRPHFIKTYLRPLLVAGWIELTFRTSQRAGISATERQHSGSTY